MYKKFISSILVVALMNLLGCYSSDLITVAEYNKIKEENKPDEIYVITKDYREYQFSDSNFYVENDTLYGRAILLYGVEGLPFEGKFAFWEIESIQFESYLTPKKISVYEFQKFDAESDKPDEIYATKYDNTRYHFMKNDYYITNDTLYGNGKLIREGKQQFDIKKIALSEIESIKVESLNETNTLLYAISIFGLIITMIVLYGHLERSINRIPRFKFQ